MREYFLNSDFDLTLRGTKSLLETDEDTFIHEMAWHYIFAASPEDSIVLHRPLPKDFIEFLNSKKIVLPQMTLHPSIRSEATFSPFGWNSYTANRNLLYHEQASHPTLEIIERANSRVFSQTLEQAWAEEDSMPWSREQNGGVFETLEALETFLENKEQPSSKSSPKSWMVKGNHGHAGTANRHIATGLLNREDHKWLSLIFGEHGSIALEPWHDRIMDMSANFQVEPGGGISEFRGHQLFNSRDGTFLGVKLFPNRKPPEPWNPVLEAAAQRLGLALDSISYFGPVSMDAYVWQSPSGVHGPQGPQLRSLVDINARQSMALPIHGIGRQLPGKTLLWIWMKPRKVSLPQNYAELDAQLGPAAFDPKTKTGILALSPIWTENITQPEKKGRSTMAKPSTAKRIGFLFSADGENELDDLRQQFARVLGKH
jgi:hypothetical protein